jgi:hypothetical protein
MIHPWQSFYTGKHSWQRFYSYKHFQQVVQVREWTKLKWQIWTNSRAVILKWLVIELCQEYIPTNIYSSKFGEFRIKTVQVREQTKLKWAFFLLIQGPLFWSAWGELAGYRT